jgi:hypothetical protein
VSRFAFVPNRDVLSSILGLETGNSDGDSGLSLWESTGTWPLLPCHLFLGSSYTPHVEAGYNTSTLAQRAVEGDEKGTRCRGGGGGGAHKYRDLVLQVGGWTQDWLIKGCFANDDGERYYTNSAG